MCFPVARTEMESFGRDLPIVASLACFFSSVWEKDADRAGGASKQHLRSSTIPRKAESLVFQNVFFFFMLFFSSLSFIFFTCFGLECQG